MNSKTVSSLMLLSLASARLYKTTSAENSPTFDIVFDQSQGMFKFTANIMQDNVLTLAFGSDPETNQTDLAVFTASGQGTLVDKWGTLSLASNDF